MNELNYKYVERLLVRPSSHRSSELLKKLRIDHSFGGAGDETTTRIWTLLAIQTYFVCPSANCNEFAIYFLDLDDPLAYDQFLGWHHDCCHQQSKQLEEGMEFVFCVIQWVGNLTDFVAFSTNIHNSATNFIRVIECLANQTQNCIQPQFVHLILLIACECQHPSSATIVCLILPHGTKNTQIDFFLLKSLDLLLTEFPA